MAEKISAEAKRRYAEKLKEYKSVAEDILSQARKTEAQIHEAEREGQSEGSPVLQTAAVLRVALGGQYLNLVSYYTLMNELSLSLLGIKNEGYLNEARKCCYKSIICLEEVVSSFVDAPFSEYQKGLDAIREIDDPHRYAFLQKMGFAIDSVIEGFGENSKWKWSFVELQGRYAVIAKNLIHMKTFLAQLDPRVEGYAERVAHLNLAKRLLQQAADRYREKYELSTLRLDDIKQAILFLAALKRLHVLLGEAEEAEVVKRKIDIWKAKMEADHKKREDALKLARLQRSQDSRS